MSGIKNWIIFVIALFMMTNGAFSFALADHGEYKNKRWYQKIFDWNDDTDHEKGRKRRRYQKRSRNDSEHHEKESLSSVDNQTYLNECGACHFAYQPELLPPGSWEKILSGLEDHFGQTIDLDKESKNSITEFLKMNSAENSGSDQSIKIIKSLRKNTPMRITEIPYIQAKHHKIDQNILQRKSIGSLSNCSACHISAEKGIYEDDDVKISQ